MRYSVLVVEDDATWQMLYGKCLNDLPLDLFYANDGAEGLTKLRERTYDLILLDLVMPNVTGLDLLARADASGLKLPPVIVCSSLDDKDVIIEALASGASNYLTKPIDAERLRGLVSALLHIEVVDSTPPPQPVKAPDKPVSVAPAPKSAREKNLAGAMAEMVFHKKSGSVLVETAVGEGKLTYERGKLKVVRYMDQIGIDALEKLKQMYHLRVLVEV